MTDPELLAEMGTDARKWAREFCKRHPLDAGLMISWFANAIEAGRDAAIAAMPSAARERELEEALGFYADPETYFAIGFFPDPPCGEFVDDFSEVEDATGFVGPRPGKRARAALAKETDVG